MSSKVEQLDIFAEQNPELKMRIQKSGFKIGIFGGANDEQSTQWAETLGKELTKKWHPIITGGYKNGIMGSTLRGAESALEEMHNNPSEKNFLTYLEPRPTGVIIEDFKPETAQTGPYINTESAADFFDRKRALITQSSAFVIFDGGTGTGAEITDVIHLNAKLGKDSKPVIFVGSENNKHGRILEIFSDDIKKSKSKNDIYFVSTPQEALVILEVLYQQNILPKEQRNDSLLDKYRLFK